MRLEVVNNHQGYETLFLFKQKTAYEIKECDWSSDVCSSDLTGRCRESRGRSGSITCWWPINGRRSVIPSIRITTVSFFRKRAGKTWSARRSRPISRTHPPVACPAIRLSTSAAATSSACSRVFADALLRRDDFSGAAGAVTGVICPAKPTVILIRNLQRSANELFTSGAGRAWWHGCVFCRWFLIDVAGAGYYRRRPQVPGRIST